MSDKQVPLLKKGDRVRFVEDYKVGVGTFADIGRRVAQGLPTERVIAAAGQEGRVIWSGKRRNNMRGAFTWRIGVVLDGAKEPVWINQRHYGSMEKV